MAEFMRDTKKLYKNAFYLSVFTVAYNFLEGIISIFVGYLFGSIALVGFGADSFVESLSGGIMIWRFRAHGNLTMEEEEKIEAKAAKLVAYSFFHARSLYFIRIFKETYSP